MCDGDVEGLCRTCRKAKVSALGFRWAWLVEGFFFACGLCVEG